MNEMLFTSESVTEGHPDKIADQISDAILDKMITNDPNSRVACETMVTTGMAIIAGEITTKTHIDFQKTVRNTIKNIGYTDSKMGFDCDTCAVLVSLDKQSQDIKKGVDSNTNKEQGAGDQGLMFGYACDETPELMPLPIQLAHRLTEKLSQLRKDGSLPELRPDGKSQVTVKYINGVPQAVTTIVISSQHSEGQNQNKLRKRIIDNVIKPIIPSKLVTVSPIIHVNPTGNFFIGGPQGDCGLTGRKIIVDTYGGMGRHGGGAFSGKDPSKVDRSAAYAARHVAKNVVSAGLSKKCEVQLSYAIGVANPVSISIDTFGTNIIDNNKIIKLIKDNFDLRPAAIIERLKLKKPIYLKTASYGHFGRELEDFTWEKTDYSDILRSKAGL